MSQSNGEWIFSIKCAICSFFANYVAGILHPLEVLKTRLQSHDGSKDNIVPRYTSIIKGLKDIHKAEGFDGLYKGIHLSMFTQAVSGALFFWIYQMRKRQYQRNEFSVLNATLYSSTEASIICTLITQPFWVVKTRVLLNTANRIGQFENTITKCKEIWAQNRFKGFYSGLSMNLILSLTGVLQMFSYQGCKIIYDFLFFSSILGEKNFICGGVSKLLTTFITYPFTTIRTRIQQDQYFNGSTAKYKNNSDIIMKIMRQEGLGGFYKGITPNLLRGIPQRGIYFYFYELFKSWMNLTKEQ